jgi:hypothetical protein
MDGVAKLLGDDEAVTLDVGVTDTVVVGVADTLGVGVAETVVVAVADTLGVGELDGVMDGVAKLLGDDEAVTLDVGVTDTVVVGVADTLGVGVADAVVLGVAETLDVGVEETVVVGVADTLDVGVTDAVVLGVAETLDVGVAETVVVAVAVEVWLGVGVLEAVDVVDGVTVADVVVEAVWEGVGVEVVVMVVDGVGVDALSEVSADRSGSGVLGIGRTHQIAILENRIFAFQHLNHHRTGDHEFDQRVEEGALAMHGIEALGLLARQMLHLRGDDLEAGFLEAAVDLTNDVLGDGIGLDDGNGALERHAATPVEGWNVVKTRRAADA